jgi:uncharacterized RDD family membrane protein YckC
MVENLASTGKRVFGAIIDVIVLVIFFVVYGLFFGKTEGASISVTELPALILFSIMFLYFVIMEATTGKTIGKYIIKTKVVNEAREKISWGQSIGRNLMRIIDGFFFYLVGFIAILASKNNQRLGDMLSKTYVINR